MWRVVAMGRDVKCDSVGMMGVRGTILDRDLSKSGGTLAEKVGARRIKFGAGRCGARRIVRRRLDVRMKLRFVVSSAWRWRGEQIG
jgi:hypothetical protein